MPLIRQAHYVKSLVNEEFLMINHSVRDFDLNWDNHMLFNGEGINFDAWKYWKEAIKEHKEYPNGFLAGIGCCAHVDWVYEINPDTLWYQTPFNGFERGKYSEFLRGGEVGAEAGEGEDEDKYATYLAITQFNEDETTVRFINFDRIRKIERDAVLDAVIRPLQLKIKEMLYNPNTKRGKAFILNQISWAVEEE